MSYKNVTDFIAANDNFIITAHETPDGDAIGSECAMFRALKQLKKNVIILNADKMAHKYEFIDVDNAVQVLDNDNQIPKNIENYALIMVDINDINNIGCIRDKIIPKIKEYFIIDHHDSTYAIQSGNHIESEASSTCEILYDLFLELNITIDIHIALALFVGIVYDTGSFIYPKTTAKTFSIAHTLVTLGINPNLVYAKIYESNSVSSLMLQSRVMASLELVFDKHVAIQTMLKELIIECDAIYEEADTIINIPLKSENIKVSIFLKENEEGILRCSMRSKGNIDVAEIAQEFGGGGHKTAAGFKSKYPLDKIKAKVLKKLEKYFI